MMTEARQPNRTRDGSYLIDRHAGPSADLYKLYPHVWPQSRIFQRRCREVMWCLSILYTKHVHPPNHQSTES